REVVRDQDKVAAKHTDREVVKDQDKVTVKHEVNGAVGAMKSFIAVVANASVYTTGPLSPKCF
ncbi:F-box family protein, partial [Trifolium medium]|nr:F-box family protein [Trifolium medium]